MSKVIPKKGARCVLEGNIQTWKVSKSVMSASLEVGKEIQGKPNAELARLVDLQRKRGKSNA